MFSKHLLRIVITPQCVSAGYPAGKFGGGGGNPGGGKAQAKQSLFLIYLDAVSITNESRPAAAEQAAGTALLGAPGMPQGGFTPRDLDFIVKFTEVCSRG